MLILICREKKIKNAYILRAMHIQVRVMRYYAVTDKIFFSSLLLIITLFDANIININFCVQIL